MHCLLQIASNGIFDFTAAAGYSCSLFVENAGASAVIEAAQINGQPISAPDGKLTLTFIRGANTLLLTINGATSGDQMQLLEDCGGGSQKLDSFTYDGDPVAIYRVYAT